LHPKASQKELENHWRIIYDEFWTLKDDGLSKLMLRKENELLIKKTRLTVLITIYNTIWALMQINIQTDRNINQKFELIKLYKNVTKNELNQFIELNEFLEKVKSSISNFENIIDKLEKELKSGGEKVQNEFEIIADLSMNLPFALNPQTVVVKEYLGYEKIAKAQNKAKQQANGKG
jgi:hypothetical protein